MAAWRNIPDIEFCYVGVEPGSWSWSHSRCEVQSIARDGNRAMVTMRQPYFTQARSKAGVTVKLPDYIENALELLDEPGEWYFDRPAKTVYYIPRPGEDMDTVEAIAPAVENWSSCAARSTGRCITSASRDIVFEHGGWLRPSTIGHCDVQANFIFDSPGRKERSPVRAASQPATTKIEEPGQRGVPRGPIDRLRALHVHATGRGRLDIEVWLARQRGLGLPVLRYFGLGRANWRRAARTIIIPTIRERSSRTTRW